jgi:hypothetical protein
MHSASHISRRPGNEPFQLLRSILRRRIKHQRNDERKYGIYPHSKSTVYVLTSTFSQGSSMYRVNVTSYKKYQSCSFLTRDAICVNV